MQCLNRVIWLYDAYDIMIAMMQVYFEISFYGLFVMYEADIYCW